MEQFTIHAQTLADQSVTLAAPVEFEVTKSFDTPAHSFEAVFPCDSALPELYSVSVRRGETQQVFGGFVDEQAVALDKNGARMKLLARSRGALLLDNEALPQVYRNVTLAEIFQNHIRPYGFGDLLCDTDPFFNTYQILKGTSEWEAFYNFFRGTMYGVAYMDDDFNIVCLTQLPHGATHTFSNTDAGAMPFSALKVTNNRYAPVSKFVIRDLDGYYSYAYDNGEATNLRLRRKRYLIPPAQFMDFANHGQKEAMARIRHSMLGKAVITLTAPGLPDIAVGDRVNLNTGLEEQYEGLFVYQVRFRVSPDAGYTTTLTLLNPAYI